MWALPFDLGILREATLEPVVRDGEPPREKPPTVLGLRWESCAAEEVRPAGCPLRLGKKEVGELAVPPTAFDPQVPAPELVSHRDLVAWIIPKNILSLVFSTLGVV